MGTDDGEGGETPSDTLRERAGSNRVKLWILLDADRYLVAGLPLCLLFVVLLVLGAVDPAPLRAAANSKDPIETLFQALTTAIITGVTLVVSLNQLVLSQELGPLGDQRERMAGTVQFRNDVAEALDVPAAPPEPSAFLRSLVDGVGNRARRLGDLVDACDDEEIRGRVSEFADSLATNADGVTGALEGEQFGTFDVLSAALNFNYSWKIYEARRIENEYEAALSEEALDALDALVETLRFFGPAREHIKTLYFQWELVNLSRGILLSAVPALIVSIAGVLYLDNPGTITGTFLGVDALVWVVVAAAAVSLVPFMLLFAYVLRIATVAKRTLSIGPFILRPTERDETLDWE
jgi:hypothetical protein